MDCLKLQPEIIKDLEPMEVELVVRSSEGYIASLKIEPNLILQIKEAQKEDGELWSVVQNMKKGKQEEIRVDDHGVICYGNRFYVPDISSLREAVLTEAHSSHVSIHHGSTKMELVIESSKLVEVTNEKAVIAKENLEEARSQQKNYVNRHRLALEFKPEDHVFLQVSLCRGV
ncbi:hypothetical protein Tco_0077694 [Tanacetum coccineum]